jgi:hypothetical protein
MRREISSSSNTALTKLAIIVFFGILVPITFIFSFESIGKLLLQMLFFLPLSFFLVRWALKLKQIEINDNGLIISQTNFGRKQELFVPFKQLKCVKQSFFDHFNPETVTIEFKEETVFGEKIKFIPKVRFFAFLDHPVVEELNQIIWLIK